MDATTDVSWQSVPDVCSRGLCAAGLPDENGRAQILRIHTARMREHGKLASDVDITELAASTKNFSGAEIEGLVRAAASTAMNQLVKVRDTHTHTHTFKGSFSGTTRVSWYQKGKTELDLSEARDSEWQWHQLGRMQVCTSLQTYNHASTPPLGFFVPCSRFRATTKTLLVAVHMGMNNLPRVITSRI